MKNLFPFLMASLLVMALGCNEGTPGGPGVKSGTTTTSSVPSTSTVPPTTTPNGALPPTTVEKPPIGTPAPGTDANPVVDPEDSFRLDAPNLSTTIKQGETKVVRVGITRAKNFDQDVALKLEGIPAGVTITPAEPVIKRGENEVNLNVKAADDAAVNDFTIKLVGHPMTGKDATNELKISVTKP